MHLVVGLRIPTRFLSPQLGRSQIKRGHDIILSLESCRYFLDIRIVDLLLGFPFERDRKNFRDHKFLDKRNTKYVTDSAKLIPAQFLVLVVVVVVWMNSDTTESFHFTHTISKTLNLLQRRPITGEIRTLVLLGLLFVFVFHAKHNVCSSLAG
jgi:hypothetical protein